MPDGPVGQDLQRRLQSLPLLAKELLAGGVAGGLSKSSIAPLERVKILFQTGRNEGRGVMGMLVNIVQTEGPIGLFRGNGASVLRIVPYAALNFTAYERYRSALITAFGLTEQPLPLPTTSSQTSSHHDDPHAHQVPAQPAPYHPIPPLLDLLAGSAAGATAVAITYPLDLVRTRLAYNIAPGLPPGPVPPADAVKAPSGQASSSPQARQYSSRSASSSSTPACSARHAGSPADSAHLRQYSSGASPHSNPRSAAPQPSWQGSRGACASALADLQGRELPSPSRSGERARPQSSGRAAAPGQARGMSASAGGSSPLSTGLPSATSRPSPSSIMGMLRMVLHTEGVVGLYRGISPTILGILPYAGLKFYVYQSLKQIYQGPYARHEKLPILTTLGFGAVSGLAAQTVTYPLDIVRRRMQVQGQVLAPRTSIMSGFRELLASGGVKALFRGLSLNYIKVVPATAIGFTVYDGMKYYLNITHLA